jgi:hypothetical protein
MVLRIVIILFLGAFVINGCGSRVQRVQKIQAQYPQWDEATVEKVASGQVEIGMTTQMVEAALGKPDATYDVRNEEIWGYAIIVVPGLMPEYEKFVYFVYFKEGKVARTQGDPTNLQHTYWYDK